jgi:hypothetical protein
MKDVIVRTELENEVSLMVSSYVHYDWDQRALIEMKVNAGAIKNIFFFDIHYLSVRLGDDTIGENSPGRLVRSGKDVPRVSADSTLACIFVMLNSISATIGLIVVLRTRIISRQKT